MLSRSTKAYKYHFNITNPLFAPEKWGVTHGAEVQVILGDPLLQQSANTSHIADLMSQSWISFFNCFEPTLQEKEGSKWASYEEERTEFVMTIDGAQMEPDHHGSKAIEYFNQIRTQNIQLIITSKILNKMSVIMTTLTSEV